MLISAIEHAYVIGLGEFADKQRFWRILTRKQEGNLRWIGERERERGERVLDPRILVNVKYGRESLTFAFRIYVAMKESQTGYLWPMKSEEIVLGII